MDWKWSLHGRPRWNQIVTPLRFPCGFFFPSEEFLKEPIWSITTGDLKTFCHTRKSASCWMWWVTSCKMCKRKRERETLIECLWQTDISKAQKAEFLLQQDFSYIWNGKLWLRHLLTDWMAKSYKRAYQSFMSNLEDLYSPAATSYLGFYQCLPHSTNTANYSLIPPTQEHEKYIYEGR
jgi:hypothetical protein